MVTTLPRLLVAAAASGQGKTTVAVGLMAALTRLGHQVAPAKVGPDYIDPGYHHLATGRPGRNLDPWLTSPELITPLLLHGALVPRPADLAIIEGVMGLYDGRMGTDGFASTAHIAHLTHSPVVLVMDISAASRTVAAAVLGLSQFEPDIEIAGVVLNRAGSDRHASEVRRTVEAAGFPVVGVLPRDAGISAPSRHLGLVPVAERPDAAASLDRLAELMAEHCDLLAIREIADTAPPLAEEPWAPPTTPHTTPRVVAIAGGRSFTFRYAETEELLRAQGLQPVIYDPTTDTELPTGTSGLYLGGGFPEAHAPSLAANTPLLQTIRDAVHSGMPTVAECAGLLYLSRSLDAHPMAGVVPAQAVMHPRSVLRYLHATTAVDSILGPAGTPAAAHEFHRTRTDPTSAPPGAWDVDGHPHGFALDPSGTGRATVHASYLHTHWAGNPELAANFAQAVHDWSPRGSGAPTPPPTPAPPVVDPLHHHGDAELLDSPDLVDLAVNVRRAAPPAWLQRRIVASTEHLAAYPDTRQARQAVADRHQVPLESVLLTNGAAEAFTLIAQAIDGRHPLVIHPQFTEPEAALRRVGRIPERHILSAATDFALVPTVVPPAADLVLVGNPTNPTGVVHPRATIEQLRRDGRILVVDEAFMDAIPGEPETLIGSDLTGLLVTRSLTKTWALAGLRAGYVVGDPALIAELAARQTPWSVSTPAAEVITATATPDALAEADALGRMTAGNRAYLVRGLAERGIRTVPGAAPFVLAQVGEGTRERLRNSGFAVRRCDTFPGLDATWARIAVRDPETVQPFLQALDAIHNPSRESESPLSTPEVAPAAPPAPLGQVFLVGGGPGDPSLLTMGAMQALHSADVVVCDRLAPLEMLDSLPQQPEVIHVGKIPRGRFTPQERINQILIEQATAGRKVVRLKGGDNFVFGRGGEEWNGCIQAGIPVTVIPGVSSAIAGPAAAGIPVTHRDLTQGFVVVSGHVPPDDPRSTVNWEALSHSGLTLVILMGLANLESIASALIQHGLAPDTPAATIVDAGLPQQREVRAPLQDLARRSAEAGLQPPAITVIGPTVDALHPSHEM